MKAKLPKVQPDTLLVQEILTFWFHSCRGPHASPMNLAEKIALWFGGAPETDALIRNRFEKHLQKASHGDYDHWSVERQGDAQSCLALILLLDQFPLNCYRDDARSFHIIEKALPFAKEAVANGADQSVGLYERFFFYLPYEHSESFSDQKISMRLFKSLLSAAKTVGNPEEIKAMETFYDYALKHYEVIERFGRYPDRNPILGRMHTPAEARYMADGGPPF